MKASLVTAGISLAVFLLALSLATLVMFFLGLSSPTIVVWSFHIGACAGFAVLGIKRIVEMLKQRRQAKNLAFS